MVSSVIFDVLSHPGVVFQMLIHCSWTFAAHPRSFSLMYIFHVFVLPVTVAETRFKTLWCLPRRAPVEQTKAFLTQARALIDQHIESFAVFNKN